MVMFSMQESLAGCVLECNFSRYGYALAPGTRRGAAVYIDTRCFLRGLCSRTCFRFCPRIYVVLFFGIFSCFVGKTNAFFCDLRIFYVQFYSHAGQIICMIYLCDRFTADDLDLSGQMYS